MNLWRLLEWYIICRLDFTLYFSDWLTENIYTKIEHWSIPYQFSSEAGLLDWYRGLKFAYYDFVSRFCLQNMKKIS